MENYNDYLFPLSLGCLDKEEKNNLKEFIESGGDFNFQELGEYQNLVSLLPCILEIETPEPRLKDDVARKLYKMKDEIKANRYKNKTALKTQTQTKESTKDYTQEKSRVEMSKEFEDLPLFDSIKNKSEEWKENIKSPKVTNDRNRDTSHHYSTYNQDEPEENKFLPDENISDENQDSEQGETRMPKTLHIDKDNSGNIIRDATPPTYQPDIEQPKRNYGLITVVFLLFFLVVVGLMIGYWKISSDVKDYKNDVEKLNKQVNSLTMRLSSSQEIEQMLQSPNVQIINLKGTNLNSSGFGKLIISPEKGNGYIQLSQMPALAEDKTFQLWISVSGNFMPLATFQASEKMEYYSFKMPTLPQGYDVSFLITEEPAGGSKTPGKKVFLTGNL